MKLPSPPAPRQPSDVLRQWHELQVSQIELELQGAALVELERQKQQVEQGLQRYAGLYEQAPVCYLSLQRSGQIVGGNRAAAALLQTERHALSGEPFERFLAPQEQGALRRLLLTLQPDGAAAVLEADLFDGIGGGRVRIEANLDQSGNVIRMIVSALAEWQVRETALRRVFVVLDNLDEGVVVVDPRGAILSVNPAFCDITGYTEAQSLGYSLRQFRDPAMADDYYAALWETLLGGRGWQGEMASRRQDGSLFTVMLSLRPLVDVNGNVASVLGVFSDISRRKQAEAALQELHHKLEVRVVQRTAELLHANGQLRQLSAHMASVKEEERKRIAREIHDELGQNLLALRLDIAQLHARTGNGQSRLARRVSSALDTIDATLRSVRGIMNELRPAVLDLGLQAALEWLVGDFRTRSKLNCRLQWDDDGALAQLDSETALVLFRIVQESLANVLRHSQASHVEVKLAMVEMAVLLTVSDNGIGIAPQHRDKPGSFGLVGIAERVDALQGSFQIDEYEAGAGCRLVVRLPLFIG